MNTTEIETALRDLGWVPAKEQTSIVFRIWVNASRPHVMVRVPRGEFIAPRVASLILRRAGAERF